MMAPLVLKDVQISTIVPFEKTEHAAAFEASLLDLGFIDDYIPLILFYKSERRANAGDLVAEMKASLSKALVPFFPFAGRWVRTYDSRVRVLRCTDEGVPFIEASVDEELDSVLNMGTFEPNVSLGGFQLLGLDPMAVGQDIDSPLPSLFIQVTKFSCGGVALTINASHMTADGQGMNVFMKAWSELALNGETSIVPCHDRSRILSREAFEDFSRAATGNPPPKDDWESNISDRAEGNGTLASSEEASRADPGAAYRVGLLEPISSRTFHVKRAAVEELKRKAAEEGIALTTVDVISGHLWLYVANFVDFNKKKPSTLLTTFIDGRTRLHNPPLPEHFTGNGAVLVGTAPIPSDEFSSYSHSTAAGLVHSAVRVVNSTNWKYSFLETSEMFAALPDLPFAHLTVSSWFRFPVYEISFGHGYGNPIFVCWNSSCPFVPLGWASILPPPPSHSEDTIASVQSFITETDGFAKALYTDEKFLSIFHSLNSPLGS